MKPFKSPQRVIIVFLTLFIVVCCFFIIRLEIKAANLQSQWEVHQKSLEKNRDQLELLNIFYRSVGKKGSCILKADQDMLYLISGDTWFTITDNDVLLRTNFSSKGGSRIGLEGNNFEIQVNGDLDFGSSSNKYFGYDSKEKLTYLYGIGKGKKVQIKGDKLLIESASGKNMISISDKVIGIDCGINGSNIGISVALNSQSVHIFTDKSQVWLEKDVIDVEAEGDINITSKNGNVNIKGKKVKVNE